MRSQQEAGVTYEVLAPHSSSLPPAACARLESGEKFRGGRQKWLGASGKEGAQPASGPGQLPTTCRITPIEPLYFPCVLGKCETGTEVLRKDKRGGKGRWPGFSACHEGQLSEGEKNWAAEHMLHCACASEETAAVGEVNLGPPGFPSLWGGRWQHQREGTTH